MCNLHTKSMTSSVGPRPPPGGHPRPLIQSCLPYVAAGRSIFRLPDYVSTPGPITTIRSTIALSALALLAGLPIAFEALVKGPLGCSASLMHAGAINLLLALAIAPVIEEVALRAGLQDGVRGVLGWRDRSGWIEIGIATLAFVALHWARSPWPLPLAWALPGLALAGLYVWRRSLIQSIAVHAAFNLAALAVCSA